MKNAIKVLWLVFCFGILSVGAFAQEFMSNIGDVKKSAVNTQQAVESLKNGDGMKTSSAKWLSSSVDISSDTVSSLQLITPKKNVSDNSPRVRSVSNGSTQGIELLPQNQVTNANIIRILKSVGLDSKVDSDGDVEVDSSFYWWVRVAKEGEFIMCMTFIQDKGAVSAATLNEINRTMPFISVARVDNDTLFARRIQLTTGGVSLKTIRDNLYVCEQVGFKGLFEKISGSSW